jgi:hypothetical protein
MSAGSGWCRPGPTGSRRWRPTYGDPTTPVYRAFAIVVLRIEDGRIVEITAFHDPTLFPAFDRRRVIAG